MPSYKTEVHQNRMVSTWKRLPCPEGGARLFMSNGTVKTHLSHIYTKLDVANRTQLAAAVSARDPRA